MHDMAAMPIVTVITVVYNGETYLEETIASVLSQSYKYIDFIIIDGGSTDGTVDIIKAHRHQLRYWISEKDSGIYDAMNKGWSQAQDNSFILFLGAGDRLISLPEHMELFPVNSVVYGRVMMGASLVCNSSVDGKLRFCNTLHHQALLVNKSLQPATPFNTAYHVYGDFDFNQKLYKRKVNFTYSDEFVAYALPGGVSKTMHHAEHFAVVKENYGLSWALMMCIFEPALKFYKFVRKKIS